MKPQTLEEFIEEKAKPLYQCLEKGFEVDIRISHALEAMAEFTASFLLQAAEEKKRYATLALSNEYEEVITIRELKRIVESKK